VTAFPLWAITMHQNQILDGRTVDPRTIRSHPMKQMIPLDLRVILLMEIVDLYR